MKCAVFGLTFSNADGRFSSGSRNVADFGQGATLQSVALPGDVLVAKPNNQALPRSALSDR